MSHVNGGAVDRQSGAVQSGTVQSGGVQSVERAFRLLQAIGDEPSSLTELARRVALPVSTASRLLATLEGLGAVERIDELGIFRIGPSILTMASSVDSSENLKAVARPELEYLMKTLNEAAGLSVAAGYTMHYVDQVDSSQAVQVQDWVGTRLPMHLVSSGLVVLANWPSEAIDNYLERELEAPTKRSLSTAAELSTRLDEVRANGFAWTLEELEPGINSVAAPILNGMGEIVGAIHIHGPAYRFPKNDRRWFEAEVVAAAERVARLLGTGAVEAVAPGAMADGLTVRV